MHGLRLRVYTGLMMGLLINAGYCRLIAEEPSWILDEKTTSLLKQGIKHNYELDYDLAIKTFQQIIHDNPKSPVGYTYLSFTLWVRELNARRELSIDNLAAADFFSDSRRYKIKIDPQREAEFREQTEKAIEIAKAYLQEHPDDPAALLMLGIAYGNLASFEATLKRSWWQAFRNGSKAEKSHRRLIKYNPPIYDAYQTVGVSDYVIGRLPLKVRWLAAAFGHHGDKERGKQELQLVAEKGVLFKEDSRLLLALILTRERNFSEAYKHLEALRDKYPKNYLLAMDMGGIAVLMNNFDLAREIYEGILKKIEASVPNFHQLNKGTVFNRLGDVYMRKKEFEKAQSYYGKTISQEKVDQDVASIAHLGLGKVYDLQGNRSEALKEYTTVLQLDDVSGTHEDAKKHLKNPYQSGT